MDLITTLRDLNLDTNADSTKEVLRMIKQLGENVNQPNFREIVTKLGIQVRTAASSVIENESFFSDLSEEIFNQTIDVETDAKYDSINDESDEDVLEKIKSQFPMLED